MGRLRQARLPAVCALAFALRAGAQASPTGAAFLSVEPSPRSYALGSTDAVSATGAQAIGRNPANLSLQPTQFEVFTSYETLLGGSQYGHAAVVAAPTSLPRRLDALGLSVTRLGVSKIQGSDSSGAYTGSSFSAQDTAAALAASSQLTQALRLGAALKALQSRVGSFSSSWSLAADVGASYTFDGDGRSSALAASAENLGRGVALRQQRDPLPTAVKLAASFPVGRGGLLLLQVQNLVPARVSQAGVGLEWALGPLSLRAGYRQALGAARNLALESETPAARALGGLTAGIGVKVGAFCFDYALSQQAVDYGATQRAALTVSWGGPRSTDRPFEARRSRIPAWRPMYAPMVY